MADIEEGKDVLKSMNSLPDENHTMSTSDMADVEEGEDVLKSMNPIPTTRRSNRRMAVSDISGLVVGVNSEYLRGNERRQPRSRQMTLTKFGYAPTLRYDDLNLAEAVIKKGTHRERQVSGLSQQDFLKEVEGEQEPSEGEDSFPFNHVGFTSEEAEELLALHGPNELPESSDPKWLVFLQQFWAPMPIMIWIAVIIEAGIQNWIDMGILLMIQFTNGSISFYETNKAGNAIAALKSSLKPLATCKRDGKWGNINATTLVPGDLVLLASGSAVPADSRVNKGLIDVDQAALTGESLPVTFYKGDSCKMGSTVVRGEVEGTVEFTGSDTFFGKTASLLQNNHEWSHLQIILMRIMYVLVGLSITCCIIQLAYLLAKGVEFTEALSFTVVLLVASIPLAIEIVTTTTLAIGSKNLVKHGAIVAKLSAIEDLAGMSILCSDKTGTLTLNEMALQDDTPAYYAGDNQWSILIKAALAAKWHEPARDALDRLTLGSVDYEELKNYEQLDYTPFDPITKRTEGTVKDLRTGKVFKTAKGAPHVMLKLLADGDDACDLVEADVARLGKMGIRSLAVAFTEESGQWRIAGLLTFLDPPRPDTKQTIADARSYGVQVKMITGDHLLIARNTSLKLDMGEFIFIANSLPMLDIETKKKPPNLARDYGKLCLVADGFAQVFPEHKYLIIECLREMGYTVGMTGDGVNDAPALKRADIGIAVSGATDAARAAADIVLTEEGLATIIHGIIYAREIFARMTNFITYRISATLQLLFFFFIALFAFKPINYDETWPEFFHMPVLMLMLITVLNDGTLITIAYDYAKASQTPKRWNLPALFVVSSVLGGISCISSLVLLQILFNSASPDGFIQKVGMKPLSYGQVTTAIYLKVSVSDFLTLFSARTGDLFFFQIKPAPILLGGGCFSLAISSILSIMWPDGTLDDIPTEGLKSEMGVFWFVWIFCIIWWFIQDAFKVLCYKLLYKYDFNNIMSTGVVEFDEETMKYREDLEKEMNDPKKETNDPKKEMNDPKKEMNDPKKEMNDPKKKTNDPKNSE